MGIIINFNDKTITSDTDTIPMKDRGTLSSIETLIEVYINKNEPQTLRYEYSWAYKFLMLMIIKYLQT
jgi:hypothetical protein